MVIEPGHTLMIHLKNLCVNSLFSIFNSPHGLYNTLNNLVIPERPSEELEEASPGSAPLTRNCNELSGELPGPGT